MSIIKVNNVTRTFEYYKKEEGMKNSFKNLINRKKLIKEAVENLDFSIEEGEIVGLLGPNGAGKTTTIKLLSGIMYPTHGEIKVLGYTPCERKNEFKKQIAVVMAQKSQLWWDLPANESILLNKYIYEISDKDYKKNLDELVDWFGVSDLISVQVRRLSLGERMKFEIISSLIHKPKVIFLDEPTIGLDLIAQKSVRDLIKAYNKQYKSTIILTSHYMQDIEELCNRAIIINNGKKVYDGLLNDIKSNSNKVISFRINQATLKKEKIRMLGKIRKEENDRIYLEVNKESIRDSLGHLINEYDITDFCVEDLPIEESIVALYQQGECGV